MVIINILFLIIASFLIVYNLIKIFSNIRNNFSRDGVKNIRNNATSNTKVLRILNDMAHDWANNRYRDKVVTSYNEFQDGLEVIYKFENDDEILIDSTNGKRSLTITNSTHIIEYELSSHTWSTVVTFINLIITQCNDGIANNRSGGKVRNKTRNTTNPNSGHPKWDRYWTLILNIRQRTSNLDEISSDDPNRSTLINELNTAKRRAKAMKDKYKF